MQLTPEILHLVVGQRGRRLIIQRHCGYPSGHDVVATRLRDRPVSSRPTPPSPALFGKRRDVW